MTTDLDQEQRAAWQVPFYLNRLWLGKQHEWCVIIPVLNEGPRIRKLVGRMASLKMDDIADTIIVDGGSTDRSLDIADLKARGIRGLLIKTGPGKLSAQLRCGYAFALDRSYDGIITIDGNNKDDPEAIPSFIETLKNGIDFVQGSRYIPGGLGENTPRLRAFAIRWIHAPLLSLFSGFRWTDTTQGFRGYSRKLLLDPKIAPFRDVFQGYELLSYLSYRAPRLGYHCIELPTKRRYPASGEIPTKILSLGGNLSLLYVLLRTCAGSYNPE